MAALEAEDCATRALRLTERVTLHLHKQSRNVHIIMHECTEAEHGSCVKAVMLWGNKCSRLGSHAAVMNIAFAHGRRHDWHVGEQTVPTD